MGIRVKVDRCVMNRPLNTAERAIDRLLDNQIIISDNQIAIIAQLDVIRDDIKEIHWKAIDNQEIMGQSVKNVQKYHACLLLLGLFIFVALVCFG